MTKRFLAAAILAGVLVFIPARAEAQGGKVNCAAYIYKNDWFWRHGNWRPVNTGGHSMTDWMRICRGRIVPIKMGPRVPQGPHRANLRLNAGCTWNADVDLRDWWQWRMANIVVS